MIEKITPAGELAGILGRQRQAGKKVVFTNGCFDLLHVGHVRYLQAARQLGDILVVGVNSDASVRALQKGPERPLVPESQRSEIVAALECVDYVIIFSESTPLQVITMLQPDILVKGGDWPLDQVIGRKEVEARGGHVCSIPLVPGISTSLLVQRIQQEGDYPSRVTDPGESSSKSSRQSQSPTVSTPLHS